MTMFARTMTGILAGVAALTVTACSPDIPEEVNHDMHAHPDCVDATEDEVTRIEQELVVPGAELVNTQMIVNGAETFVGASVIDPTIDPTGVLSRSEVWQISDAGQVYSVSQGAVDYTGLPLSDTVNMLDSYPGGVDRCTILESEDMDGDIADLIDE